MPIITEYADCLGVTYGTPKEAERSDYRFVVPFWLVNGRLTEVTVCARQVRGGFRVTELLLDKQLPFEDVQDLAELEWHVFPKDKPGTRVPPPVRFWEQPDLENVVAACVSSRFPFPHEDWQPWEGFGSKWPWMELCPWPNFRLAVGFAKALARQQGKIVKIAFYPLQEYLGKQVALGTNVPNPGIAYSRYLRDLRTFLWIAREWDIPVVLKLGCVDRALEAMKKRGLDPGETQSWDAVADSFPDMPEVLVEEKWASDVRGRAGDFRANVGLMGHLGKAGHVDCAVAELFDLEDVLVGRIVCWLNPLAPAAKTLEKAQAILAERVTKITWNIRISSDVQPFPEEQAAARSLCR